MPNSKKSYITYLVVNPLKFLNESRQIIQDCTAFLLILAANASALWLLETCVSDN